MYSTLALEKGREIVKEETALRKEKEAVHVQCTMHNVCSWLCVYCLSGLPFFPSYFYVS